MLVFGRLLGILASSNVPLVILLADRFGMSFASRSAPEVTMPCPLYVILHLVAPVMFALSALPPRAEATLAKKLLMAVKIADSLPPLVIVEVSPLAFVKVDVVLLASPLASCRITMSVSYT